MNLFYHPCMLPEIFKMAVFHAQAREQIKEIRKIAREKGISAKYVKGAYAKRMG